MGWFVGFLVAGGGLELLVLGGGAGGHGSAPVCPVTHWNGAAAQLLWGDPMLWGCTPRSRVSGALCPHTWRRHNVGHCGDC